MKDRSFIDTNVFVYSFDETAPRKREAARELIETAMRTGRGMISFQVIQEFSSVALKKFSAPFTVAELREYLRTVLAPLCEVQSSFGLYETCLSIREQTSYSFYDALILAAAVEGGCRVLHTEDLRDGQEVAGVTIRNPFR